MNSIDALLQKLSHQKVPPNAYNQYALGEPDNQIRRNNLRIYLSLMKKRHPFVLMIGEAPSYRGCKVTGVPFMGGVTLLEGHPLVDLFGAAKGYRLPGGQKPMREHSGTIFWNALGENDFLPVVWPSFPFHPFKSGKPQSNRPPTQLELEIGKPYVQAMLEIFPIQQVIALGRKGEKSLQSMGIPHTYIRHPAQGGKPEFVRGIQEFCQKHPRP